MDQVDSSCCGSAAPSPQFLCRHRRIGPGGGERECRCAEITELAMKFTSVRTMTYTRQSGTWIVNWRQNVPRS
jgi:hypothetical protein